MTQRCYYCEETDQARAEARLDAVVDEVFDRWGYAMRILRKDLKDALRALQEQEARAMGLKL